MQNEWSLFSIYIHLKICFPHRLIAHQIRRMLKEFLCIFGAVQLSASDDLKCCVRKTDCGYAVCDKTLVFSLTTEFRRITFRILMG